MNNTFQFRILFCLFAAFLMTSCEKSDIQKTTSLEENVILPRTDCQYCPDNHCCCSIEILSVGAMTFEFCGTSGSKESTTACGPTSITGCSGDIDGYTWIIQVNPNDKRSFCMEPGTPFMLKISAGTGTVRITCQEGATTPQTVTIPVSSPNKYYFNVNGTCEVIEC
jgi:hypothetical protein